MPAISTPMSIPSPRSPSTLLHSRYDPMLAALYHTRTPEQRTEPTSIVLIIAHRCLSLHVVVLLVAAGVCTRLSMDDLLGVSIHSQSRASQPSDERTAIRVYVLLRPPLALLPLPALLAVHRDCRNRHSSQIHSPSGTLVSGGEGQPRWNGRSH